MRTVVQSLLYDLHKNKLTRFEVVFLIKFDHELHMFRTQAFHFSQSASVFEAKALIYEKHINGCEEAG